MKFSKKCKNLVFTDAMYRSKGDITVDGKYTKIHTEHYSNLFEIAKLTSSVNGSFHK